MDPEYPWGCAGLGFGFGKLCEVFLEGAGVEISWPRLPPMRLWSPPPNFSCFLKGILVF